MALYRFEAKIIKRSQGRSACSAAAYRAGQKITSEYDGETYDYRMKQNIEDAIIILPDNAPVEYIDRAVLWNAVELNEKAANAQLAREIMLVLPRELPFELRRQMTIEYVNENFVSAGMCADIAWHNPPRMNSRKQPIDMDGNVTNDPSRFIYDNPHVHILLTLRPFNDSSEWEQKKIKLYICEKDGEQRLFSSDEMKKAEGWEKIYHYTDHDGHKSWLTRSYVADHPECEYKLNNKYPKSVQDVNPKIARWNSPETLVDWRAAWAEKINMVLKMHGIDEHVSHLSYAEQGIDIMPTVHEGKEITIIEKRLREEYERKIAMGEEAVEQHTEIRNLNIAIGEHNRELKIIQELKELKNRMEEVIKPVIERIDNIGMSIAESLEHLRQEIIKISIKIKDALSLRNDIKEKVRHDQEYIKALAPVRKDRIVTLQQELKEYKERYEHMNPLYRHKKAEINQKIGVLENAISIYTENVKYANKATKEINILEARSKTLEVTITDLEKERDTKIDRYHMLEDSIPEDNIDTVMAERLKIRQRIEEDIKERHRYDMEARLLDCPERHETSEVNMNRKMKMIS